MLSAIELRNFKAFREERIELAPLTLLSGLNGSGKSSVLQSLALIRQSWEAGMLEEGCLLLNGDLVALGTGRDVLHEDYVSRDGQPARISVLMESGLDEFEWEVDYERDADLLQGAELFEPAGQFSLFKDGFQYIRADRVGPAVYYPRTYEKTVRQRSLGARGEHTVNYLRAFGDEPVSPGRRHSGAKSTRLLDQVGAWLQELCPDVNIETHEIEGTDSVRLDFGFHGTAGIDSSNRYRPTNVGFGLTYALPLVVACLASPEDSVLLLENPEAHLHPAGQGMMASLCAKAAADGIQIICESHSDHFLNGMRLSVKHAVLRPEDTSVLYFERATSDGVRVRRPEIGRDGLITEWPIGFFDEWDRALGKILEG